MPILGSPCRSPAVLSLSEDGLVERVEFLEELGLSQEQLAKVTVAHPQVRVRLEIRAFKVVPRTGVSVWAVQSCIDCYLALCLHI